MTVVQLDPGLEQDKARWNSLLNVSFNSSYRHSLGYLLSGTRRKKSIFIFMFSESGQDVAGAVYSFKRDQLSILKVAEIQYGVLFRSEEELNLFPKIVEHFLDWAKIIRASYSIISPWLLMTFNGHFTDKYIHINKVIASYGFKPVKDGQHTYLINLNISEEDLLSRMNRSTRKLVKRGLRSEIITEVLEHADKEILDSFWHLYSRLSETKKFGSLAQDIFYSRVKGLISAGHALLILSRFRGKVISATMISLLGTPAGMYGAIDTDFKAIDDCISPGPLSTWVIIAELKKRGFSNYDMGFCPGKIPDRKHPAYSVWNFKYNFGPDHAQFMPTYGLTLRPLRGLLFEYLRYSRQNVAGE